jgi:hypothetical protein
MQSRSEYFVAAPLAVIEISTPAFLNGLGELEDHGERNLVRETPLMSPPCHMVQPVPPYFFAVDASAWENSWNNLASCSGVMSVSASSNLVGCRTGQKI